MKQFFTGVVAGVKITLKHSPDRMKLFMDAVPAGEKVELTGNALDDALRPHVAPALFDARVIEDILKNLHAGKEALERRIAKGYEPKAGSDGHILYLVKRFTGEVEVRMDDRGFATFSELHLFDNVTKGMLVARVYPPKTGVPGRDALGVSIPAPLGNEPKIEIGKGLLLESTNEGFKTVTAQGDGFLVENAGKLELCEEFVVKGDLDFHYGNIDFIGAVKVMGDVLPGFSIVAKNGIEINGSMRGDRLVCPQGNIVVKGYMHGASKSQVICAKDFTVRVAQEVNISCIGAIRIEKECIDSNLRTESIISLPNGRLIGGKAFAVCGLEAKELGAEAENITEVFLCSTVETTTEFAKLVANIEAHDKAITLTELHLGPFAKKPILIERLKGGHREKMELLSGKLVEIRASKVRLLAQKEALLEGATISSEQRVNVLGQLHPGVVIHAGKHQFKVKERVSGPVSIEFVNETSEFKVGELKPIECKFAKKEKITDQPAEEKK